MYVDSIPVLVLFLVAGSIEQRKNKCTLVLTGFHPPFLGHYHFPVTDRTGMVVDHDLPDSCTVGILAAHLDAVALDPVVKDAFPDGKCRLLLADIVKQRTHLQVRVGQHFVRKQEGQSAHQESSKKQWQHDPLKGDSGCFGSSQFEVFGHVAEGHNGRYQDGQWQGHRDQVGRRIEQKLCDDHGFKAFSDQVVDVFPQELHKQHEQGDEKGHQKWPDEALEYKGVEFLQSGVELDGKNTLCLGESMPAMHTIGSEEEALLLNDQVYLVKQRLSQQLVDILGECAEVLRCELEKQPGNLPAEVLGSSAKISKGENYLGRPWTILDYPRVFSHADMFAFRTLCWWGQGFSMTLLLKGKYLEAFKNSLSKQADELAESGFYLGVSGDPFVHHFGEENIVPLNRFKEPAQHMLSRSEEAGFLKLVKLLELRENRNLVTESVETWRIISRGF